MSWNNLPGLVNTSGDIDGLFRGGFFEVDLTVRLTGDTNGDDRIDDADAEGFVNCVSGPGTPKPASGCGGADVDCDDDVDLKDFATLQLVFDPAG